MKHAAGFVSGGIVLWMLGVSMLDGMCDVRGVEVQTGSGVRAQTVADKEALAAARKDFEVRFSRAKSAGEKAEVLLRIADMHAGVSEHARAREYLERALKLSEPGGDLRCRIQLQIARSHVAEYEGEAAKPLLEEILSSKEILPDTRAGAFILRAQIHARYGVAWAWEKVCADCEAVLALPGVGIENQSGAHALLAEALLTQRNFASARRSMRWIAQNAQLAPSERARQQMALVRTALLEGNARQALEELPAARVQLDALADAPAHMDRSAEKKQQLAAEYELLRGLALCDAGRKSEAREVLSRVKQMPGQTAASPETREAAIKMQLRGLLEGSGECLKVLMVGSSLTIRGNIPYLIEQLAASAPSEYPRICVGEHVRMGTGMRTFWAEGEAPDTVRHKIRSEPWDVVVVESFYRMPEADLQQFGGLYADLVRGRGARMVLYETPAAKTVPYPEGFETVHEANVRVGARLGVSVAPGLLAWTRVLGPSPGPMDFARLYSDALHATLHGAYVSACSVYSAVTGRSPVGLFYPEGIPAPEARVFQEAAWEAFEIARRQLTRESSR